MTLYELAAPTRWGFRDLAPDQLPRGQARIVDVREPAEFAAGHVPDSELVPLASIDRYVTRWDKDKELVLVCRSGARSARAAEALASAGFRRVMNLAGGMIAYAAAGLPIER
jgi:sulfur-carrier protein adenylyltransferase/sulfurtransferase